MREFDYIVVGCGIAGIAACERLEARGLSYLVIDSGERSATRTAGGVVNPVVLKRFSPVWRSADFIKEAREFYEGLSTRMNSEFRDNLPLYRIFHDNKEQNDWTVLGDSRHHAPYLSQKISHAVNENVNAKFGLGEVFGAFRIDTALLMQNYQAYLLDNKKILKEPFDYAVLDRQGENIRYKEYRAKKILFTEGISAMQNPYFKPELMIPKKGEYITFKSTQLKLEALLKGPYFIIPLGGDLYQVGATFAHGDTSSEITQEGKIQLQEAVAKMINCPFEIVDQTAGMRPTTKDRRPILGVLGDDKLIFFNGLGTRGLLMAPLLSKWLLDYTEDDVALPEEVDIKRFGH